MAAQDLKIDIIATDKTGAAFKSVKGGLDDVNKSAGLVSTALSGLTAIFAAIQVVQLSKGLIDVADRMDELSKRTGIAIEELSNFSNTATLSGLSGDDFATSLSRLNKAIGEAASGSKDQALAFKNLGVSIKDADGNIRPTTAVLADLADAFSNVEDGAIKGQYQLALFGRSGDKLNEFLSKGSIGIKEFGGSISKDFAEQSAQFNDNLTLIGQRIQKEFGERATPILEKFNKEMANVWRVEKLSTTGIVNSQAEVRRIDNKSGKIELPPIDPKIAKAAEDVANKLQAVNDEILKMTAGEQALSIVQFSRMEGVTKPQIAQYDALLKQKAKLAAQDRELEAASREADELAKKALQEKIDLANKGKKIYEDTRTPMEQMNIQMAELDRLLQIGIIDWDTYARATMKAAEAFDNIKDKGQDSFAELKYAFEGWGRDFTNIMADAALNGKLSFSDMANSIIRDLLRIQIQKMVTDPLVKAGTSFLDSYLKPDGARAMGGPVTSGQSYLVGENGPEIFTPYGSGSITPNNSIGGGVSVNIVNNSGASATAKESVDSRGQRRIDVMIGDMVASEISRAGSGANGAIRRTFGASPMLAGR